MKPELRVRRLVHSMGYRYRLHRKDLPGKPRLGLFGPEEGDLRSWLFLAPACRPRLQARPPSQVQPGLLVAEARTKCGPAARSKKPSSVN